MTTPPALQQRMCHSKRIYMSETGARMWAQKAERKTGKPLRAYHCPNCGFWHLTTKL